ncbi:uncharacterized protein LOC110597676 [Ictidomys tridecemlineatus]
MLFQRVRSSFPGLAASWPASVHEIRRRLRPSRKQRLVRGTPRSPRPGSPLKSHSRQPAPGRPPPERPRRLSHGRAPATGSKTLWLKEKEEGCGKREKVKTELPRPLEDGNQSRGETRTQARAAIGVHAALAFRLCAGASLRLERRVRISRDWLPAGCRRRWRETTGD